LPLPHVGTLTRDDQVILKRGRLTFGESAKQPKQERLQVIGSGGDLVLHKIRITHKGQEET